MNHEVIDININGSHAKLYTYFLDNSIEIDEKRVRPTIIICPGGGYEFTSDREAEPIAIQMNALGFNACILRYSVYPNTYPTALLELAQSVVLIRKKAEKWHVDKKKIIIAGFSAGGHLAASLGVFWDKDFLSNQLGCLYEDIKPDGLLLSYPVITSGRYAHKGSFKALLGERYEKHLSELSLEDLVTNYTPPTFLWHTRTDETVPVENSILFANALLKNNVPMEIHIYPRGIHGLALGTEETKSKNYSQSVLPEVSNWVEMAGRWIQNL
ncbi:alpha/beta hydrolase [Aquibacillus koreensis]|uniref:Alpha/beta hydrolase n=1 Tax=Aquibacillus koreensis TaxID=279446 RepID=A0A9X3WKN0_9BACI|nr:alpha/beta hydrolase [Aquibacillus koreensis]MCT2536712.1 alpha/beta hydrolase [Aquibacillus koreensis]MDC3421532.1 alpha/beta hydrolase [Aquibacillus koreensis]